MQLRNIAILASTLMLSANLAAAGPGHGTESGHDAANIGAQGDPSQVDRTIEIKMTEMRFNPKEINISPGETIKFVIVNKGRFVHEFNLGTEEMWASHADEMRTMMEKGMMTPRKLDHAKMMQEGMMHDDPNSILLEGGQTAEVIWTFPEGGEFGFACNVPGHKEAGMVGQFVF